MLSFEIVNDDFKNYVTSSKVYIANAGDSITVKGTYTYWDNESNQKTVVGEGQIVAVAPAVWTIGTVTGMITNDALIKDDFSLNGDAKAATWTMDNPTVNLQIAVPFTKNTKTVYEGFGKDYVDVTLYKSYKAKVADETVALIAGTIADGKLPLKANKAGSTTILIYGVTNDDKEVVIGAVPVTVKDERKIGSSTVTASKTNINLDYAEDSVSYEIVVKDQDGQDYIKAVDVAVEDKTSDKLYLVNAKSTKVNGPKITITIGTGDLTTENGVHNVKFTVNNESKVLRLSAAHDGEAARYLIKISGNELKTGIKTDTTYENTKSIKIELEGLSKTGSAASASGVAIKFTTTQPKAAPVDGYTGDKGFVYTITKDGKLISAVADKPKTLDEANNVITAFVTGNNASGAAVKLDKGTYVITAYEIKQSGSSYVPTSVGAPQTFTVTDDQAAVEVKKNSNAEKLTTLDEYSVIDAFDINFNGANAKGNANIDISFVGLVNVASDGLTAYVKGVNVTIKSAVGQWKIYAPIDTLVKKG